MFRSTFSDNPTSLQFLSKNSHEKLSSKKNQLLKLIDVKKIIIDSVH